MIYKVNLPKKWDENLAYLFGLLLGDGSLPKGKSKRKNGKIQIRYSIQFFSNSKDFVEEIYLPLFKNIFGLKPSAELRNDKINPLYHCRIESKTVYTFLEKWGYITGRKAKIAKVPESLPKKYYNFLLAGLLDTDGGKKGGGFGLSTASEKLANFCIQVFRREGIKFNSCPWVYNNHTYHQIYSPKSGMGKILKTIPIKNKDKIDFIKSNASVAQW